eukprot:scaffold113357_cov52-Attheya_sp.AAC.1
MKKAFCEPENVEFCPPIVLASVFGGNDVLVSRSEENGGDVTYRSRAQMEADFASGALHPGDLKAVATSIMVQTLTTLSSAMKKDNDATKAGKALKALQKKLAKKK